MHYPQKQAHTVMDAKSVMKTIELWAKETRRMMQTQSPQAHGGSTASSSTSSTASTSRGEGSGSGSTDGGNEDMDVSSGSASSSASEEFDEEVLLGPQHLDQIGA